jgi:16S rRNA (cytidine1402-2'-O)-methyltransferase
MVPGNLYVVATPIGNLEDMTLRAIRILNEVKLIAAEDTRQTRKLMSVYHIHTPLTSLHEHNEQRKGESLIRRIEAGEDMAFVSDAGTPGISDPGYHLIRAAVARQIKVIPIPGASAAVTALCVSGLPMDRFLFYGFLPAKATRRRQALATLAEIATTMVFYESPGRLAATLQDMESCLGDRPVAICRELTKAFEEITRGTLADMVRQLSGRTVKGEVTIIVGGGHRLEKTVSDEEIMERIGILEKGMRLSRRDRIDRVAQEMGVSRKRVYDLAVQEDDGD